MLFTLSCLEAAIQPVIVENKIMRALVLTTAIVFLEGHQSVSLACYSGVLWADQIRSELHWLDIPLRFTFKLCLFAYWYLHGSALLYLISFRARHSSSICSNGRFIHDENTNFDYLPSSICCPHVHGTDSWLIFVIPALVF